MGDSTFTNGLWWNSSGWTTGLVILIILIMLLILAAIFYRISVTGGYFFHCDVTSLASESEFSEFHLNRDEAMSSLNTEIYDPKKTSPHNASYTSGVQLGKDQEKSKIINIAVISVSIGDRPFAKISHNRLESYCKTHNYDLFYYTENLDDSYKPFWQKVIAMKRVLSMKNPGGSNKYDMAFWIDDDIYITNMGYRIEDFLILSEDKDIVMSRDVVNDYNIYINTGTYIIKNTEIGHRFLDETLEGYYWYKGWYQSNRFHEQTIMTYLYFRDYYKYTTVLPHGIMQSFYRGNYWKYGDFSLHLAGNTTKTRTEIMASLDKCDIITGQPWYQHVATTEEWRYVLNPTQMIPSYACPSHSHIVFYDSTLDSYQY